MHAEAKAGDENDFMDLACFNLKKGLRASIAVGIGGNLLLLIESFLMGRTVGIRLGAELSDWQKSTSGVA